MTPPRTAAPTRASIGSQATAKPVAWRYPIRGGRYATTTNEDDARRASTDGTVDALCVIGNNGLTKQQALEVIEREEIHLILSDIRLRSHETGIDLAAAAKKAGRVAADCGHELPGRQRAVVAQQIDPLTQMNATDELGDQVALATLVDWRSPASAVTWSRPGSRNRLSQIAAG